jgi:hypothetical protein
MAAPRARPDPCSRARTKTGAALGATALLVAAACWLLARANPAPACPAPVDVSDVRRNLSRNARAFRIPLTKSFKWDFKPAVWTSAFMASNDVVDNWEEIADQLSSLPPEELEFVSVVGGMKFFELLEGLSPGRITLFDNSINQLMNVILAFNYVCATPHAAFDGFVSLHRLARHAPERFYLPAGIPEGQVTFATDAGFTFPWGGRETSLFTLLNPEDYPELRWRPTEAAYAHVRRLLCTPDGPLNPDLHLQLPPLKTGGRLVLAFLSHIEPLTPGVLSATYRDASVTLPLYSNFHPTHSDNSLVLNAHPQWEHVIQMCIVGTSMHIWSDTDASLLGSVVDRGWDTSTVATPWLAANYAHTFDTVILHIIFGKDLTSHLRPLVYQQEHFAQLVQKASRVAARRVLIADFDRSSGQFDSVPDLPPRTAIVAAASANLRPAFKLVRDRDIGGQGHHSRNFVAIYDRVD